MPATDGFELDESANGVELLLYAVIVIDEPALTVAEVWLKEIVLPVGVMTAGQATVADDNPLAPPVVTCTGVLDVMPYWTLDMVTDRLPLLSVVPKDEICDPAPTFV